MLGLPAPADPAAANAALLASGQPSAANPLLGLPALADPALLASLQPSVAHPTLLAPPVVGMSPGPLAGISMPGGIVGGTMPGLGLGGAAPGMCGLDAFTTPTPKSQQSTVSPAGAVSDVAGSPPGSVPPFPDLTKVQSSPLGASPVPGFAPAEASAAGGTGLDGAPASSTWSETDFEGQMFQPARRDLLDEGANMGTPLAAAAPVPHEHKALTTSAPAPVALPEADGDVVPLEPEEEEPKEEEEEVEDEPTTEPLPGAHEAIDVEMDQAMDQEEITKEAKMADIKSKFVKVV